MLRGTSSVTDGEVEVEIEAESAIMPGFAADGLANQDKPRREKQNHDDGERTR